MKDMLIAHCYFGNSFVHRSRFIVHRLFACVDKLMVHTTFGLKV